VQIDPFLRANPLHGDAGSYDRIARSLMGGAGFAEIPGRPTAFWPPLYPMFLAGLYSLFGYNPLVPRLVQAVLGVVTVGATFEVARLLFDRRVAIFAGLGIALYPHLIYFSTWLIAEAMYMALLAITVLVAVKLQVRQRWRDVVLLGVLLGLGILAKPATLMLVPLLALWVLLAFSTQPLTVRLGYFAIILLVLAVVVAPWTLRNHLVFDDFVLVSTNGGYTFYGANNGDAFGGHYEGFPPRLPGLSEPEAEAEYYRLAIEWITRHPGDFLRLVGHKLARLFSPLSVASFEEDYPLPLAGVVEGVYSVFLGLAGVGLLRTLPRWREVFLLHMLILRVLVGTILFYGDARYTLPMVPALVILAAVALTWIWRKAGSARGTLRVQKGFS
jgi:4-amino-4-deoxy-L-arabinose transferase-like glycosyltransferase